MQAPGGSRRAGGRRPARAGRNFSRRRILAPQPGVVPPEQGVRQHREGQRRHHRLVREHVHERQHEHEDPGQSVRRHIAPVTPYPVREEAEVEGGAQEPVGDQQQPELPGAAHSRLTAGEAVRRRAHRDRRRTALLMSFVTVADQRRGGGVLHREDGQGGPDSVAVLVRCEPLADHGVQRADQDDHPGQDQARADRAEQGHLAPGPEPNSEIACGDRDPDPDPPVQRVHDRHQGYGHDRQRHPPLPARLRPGHEQPWQQDGQAISPGVGVVERGLRAALGDAEDVLDLGESGVHHRLHERVGLKALRYHQPERRGELEGGKEYPADAADDRVDPDQPEQPGKPQPGQLAFGQVSRKQQQHADGQVAGAAVGEGDYPVPDRAGGRTGGGQRQRGGPGQHADEEQQPHRESWRQPQPAPALHVPAVQPQRHRDREQDEHVVGDAQRPPERVAGEQRDDRPGGVAGEPGTSRAPLAAVRRN